MEKTPFGEEVFPQLTLSAGVFSKIKMAKVELRGWRPWRSGWG
jgi:hypothetical protein